MATREQLKSNIWKYYLFSAVHGMFFVLPVLVLFWQDNGLSLFQIMILEAIFAIAVVGLEVPTGYFADKFGRKKSLVYAGVALAGGSAAYAFGSNFTHFLIAELVYAVGVALWSGANSAFVYDTLKDLRQEHTYKKVWGHAIFLRMLFLAITAIIGGFVGGINLRWPVYLVAGAYVFLAPIALTFTEPKQHKVVIKKGYIEELMNVFKFTLLKNKKVKWLIIYSAVIFAFNSGALWFYQPYFKFSGLDVMYFGIVFAAFHLVSAAASKYSYKIEEKLGSKYSLIMLVILVASSYFLMSNFIFLFSFSFAFLQQIVKGFHAVVISDYINKLTSSDIRATVLSIESMMGKLLYAAVLPIAGYIADVFSIVQAFTIMGISVLVAGGSVLLVLRKEKVI